LDDAETVPSRGINRLRNLMSGVASRNGPAAWAAMSQRGLRWLDTTTALEAVTPVAPAGRAAPRPPVAARPRNLSVTEIKQLIRDPYAIYAKYCLKLRPLDPLVQEPDAPIRGTIIHKIMELFMTDVAQDRTLLTVAHLTGIADTTLEQEVPWPTARTLWQAHMARVAPWIIDTETKRLARGQPAIMEKSARGVLHLPKHDAQIRGEADRIDLTEDGAAIVYDYKSGTVPTPTQMKLFDKQLLIEAVMVENGAFQGLGPRPVDDALYIGLGANPIERHAPLDEESAADTLEGLNILIGNYLRQEQYYLSRRMMEKDAYDGDYDHLARFGEWDDASDPAPEDLT